VAAQGRAGMTEARPPRPKGKLKTWSSWAPLRRLRDAHQRRHARPRLGGRSRRVSLRRHATAARARRRYRRRRPNARLGLLGLETVSRHWGGTLSVHSPVRRGTTVSRELPVMAGGGYLHADPDEKPGVGGSLGLWTPRRRRCSEVGPGRPAGVFTGGLPRAASAPAVSVSEQRTLHKSRHGSCGSSTRDRPRSRDHCVPVSVTRLPG
jgi:hypothetical protein